MKKHAVIVAVSCIFFVFIPYLSTLGMTPAVVDISEYDVTVLNKDGSTSSMNAEEYICNSIVALSDKRYNAELIKAMAVCEYSYLAYSHQNLKEAHKGADICADETHCRPVISTAEAKKKHGEDYYQTVTQCIRQVRGKTISYAGRPAAAVYFVPDTFSVKDCPYMITADKSAGDSYRMETECMAGILKFMIENSGLFDDSTLSDNPEEWITDIEYSDTGRVLSADVGGVRCDSEKLGLVLGLQSDDFTFTLKDDIFTFICFGYEGTVGMDISEGNIKAETEDYSQILEFYFPGAEQSVYRWK